MSFKLVFALTAASLFAAQPPQRIISLSPNTTEILYGVGAFPQVVAVSQFCDYPPAAAKLPHVGAWQTDDVEKIVALKPDLVVLTRAQEPFITDKLKAFSLQSIAVPSDSLADIYTAMTTIGNATGHEKQAADLVNQTRAALDRIRAKTANQPRPTVLISVDRTPGTLSDLYVATQGSYLIDLIDIAGGKSVAAPQPSGYGKLSQEALLSLNPDIIIDLVHRTDSRMGEHVTDAWNEMPELRAVQTGRIYPVYDPSVVHPSQFVVHTAELFLHILHPEPTY